MKIAVYTIALNEEQFVERWHESAKEADVLLIADTGSQDQTVAKAISLGIRVIPISIKPWRFDDARNAALAVLPHDVDICVSLDMDEVLLPGWREEIEKAFDQGATQIKYNYVWNWNEDGTPGITFHGDKMHARYGYRWRHPVHETLYADRIESKQFISNATIYHFPDNNKPRLQYLPLLSHSVLEDPHNDRIAFYYARELFFYDLKDQATQEFIRHLSLPSATWKPERAASYRYLGKIADDFISKERMFKQAIEESPERREPYVDLAELYYLNKMWKSCLEYSEKAISITKKPLDYLCEDFAWGYAPYDFGCVAAYNLGYNQKALEYSEKALEINPDDERLKKNKEECIKAFNF
jgi:glycosyltransferase involved in cell wall biosynthesis